MSNYIGRAQSIDRQVLAGGGGQANTATIQLNFTIGETAIQYLSTSGISLSQGFQQTAGNTTGMRNTNKTGAQLSIYPNPFVQYIAVRSDKKLSGPTFILTDEAGRNIAVSSKELEKGVHWRIEVRNIAAGHYWLKIKAKDYENTIPILHTAP